MANRRGNNGNSWSLYLGEGSKITADGDCSHEIKRPLLLGSKSMTNLLTAKSLQSCPTLCNPIDRSPPGSPAHGIFQARVLEWGAIAFSNLDSILKSRDIILPTKVCLVKAMVFPVVMYGCESWTIKKAWTNQNAWGQWTWKHNQASTTQEPETRSKLLKPDLKRREYLLFGQLF